MTNIFRLFAITTIYNIIKNTEVIMSKMNEKNEKILKIIHIVTMSLWFSSIVIMGTITFSLKSIANSDAFAYAHHLVYFIDMYVLTPAAVLTLLTAIVYAFFTQWKVKENAWLKIKAIITIVLILAGTFYLAPLFTGMMESVNNSGLEALSAKAYLQKLTSINWLIIINAVLVLFAIAISTLKPGKSAA
jgi:hypothetical protein